MARPNDTSTTSTHIPVNAILLTPQQVADLAQIDVRTFSRWCSQGLVPGRVDLPGRTARYDRATILEWLKSRKAG